MRDAPIDVLFDVTFLGRVQAGPQRTQLRAGIHRVVENMVRALAADPNVAMTLGARANLDSALAYVADDVAFRRLPFPVPARRRLGWRWRDRVIAAYGRPGASRTTALPARAVNRVLRDVNRILDPLAAAIRRTGVRAHAVFHSPFEPLPPQRARVRGTQYFGTVYDLIPIRCPEVVANVGDERWLYEIIESIGADDHVIAISQHTRSDLLTARPELAPEQVHVAYLAADERRFHPCDDPERITAVRRKYDVPDAPYVLAVGTLAPHKNIPHLVRAFANVVRAERLHDLHLVLTGATGVRYEHVLEELGRMDDVRDRVILTGYVDDDDLAPLYSGALTFVCPSYYEGFGLTPLEAMQCGAPVIAGNRTSLPEVVGDAALMVDPHDSDALAQALLTVYHDAALRGNMRRRSLARAREFTWARTAAQVVGAYRTAL